MSEGSGSGSCESTVTMTNTWSTGATGSLHLTFPKTVSSWKIEITFSLPVTSLAVYDGSNVQCSGNICSFENLGWNAQQSAGNKAKFDFTLAFASLPNVEKVTLDGTNLCSGSGSAPMDPPPVTTTTNAPGPVSGTDDLPPPATTGTTTTAAPPGTTTTTKPSSGKKVVCYYPNWAHWRQQGSGKFTVDDIDPSICTHLIYAFVALNPETYTVKVFDPYLDITLKNFEKFTNLKSANPDLKVLVALGGWTDSQGNKKAYKTLFATQSLRTKFIEDALNFLETHNFDGIDLDYEFPVEDDKDNFGLFVKELREGLDSRNPQYELTAATSASPSKIAAGYPIGVMNDYMNAWHLMSYDMHGTWEGLADHHAPLYSRPWDVSKRDIGDTGSPNVDSSVQWLINQGIAKGQLISKGYFDVFKSTKKPTIFLGFLP